ncbi:MAG: DNA-3-methyladenine glycosylase 2 family protein [Defluviitaleaceae bacterium]|nr:DNA-3-methyladenine glycosylase 2 family protein [Defluviitaleaceae bacterium]
MDYTTAEQKGSDIVLSGVRCFNLAQTLDNGQAFRWLETDKGKFSGVAKGRRLELFSEGENLVLRDVSPEEFETVWKDYFDFSRNYTNLREKLSAWGGDVLRDALAFSPGLRLMRQDVWEILISFILSQNSNIPRIKKMISLLCEFFGEKLPCGAFAFPTPETLAALSPKNLAPIKCGYRAGYIIDAACKTAGGLFNPSVLAALSSDEIKDSLLKIHGVGPKVAECVLLYGFGRVERFPLDVWMKRVMSQFYPTGFPSEIKNYSGIAQQFLFHYARNFFSKN